MRGRARWQRPVAIGAGAALCVAGLSVPAQAALDNYPDDPAEAGASVLNSSLMEQELLGAATSDAGFPTNPGPNTENLDVDVLGGQILSLGDVQVPIDQFADFGQLGALASTSEASSPIDGHAASGLIGPDGGVTLEGTEEEDWGTATIDLLALADATGTDGFTDLLVDQLDLELGAFGAEVIAEDGVFLDPDGGVTGPGQYIAGDASLYLHSPAIEDAAAQIFDLGGQVDTTIEDLVNQTFDIAGLISDALAVPGLPDPECSVDSDMQDNIVNAVVGEPLTSANQLITIDFSAGTMEIHLEHLVEGNDPWGGGDDAGLNGLAPNTEIINETTYPLIAETVHELMEEAAQLMATAVEESLESVTFTCSWFQEGPLPGDVIDVTWGPINLADAAAGTFPPVETNCTGITATVACEALALAIDTGSALLAPVFGTVYDFLISDEAHAVYDLLINDIKTGLITETIGTALSPVFDVINQFISLQVNHQETVTCVSETGDELLSSLEVSALSLGLVGGDLARIGLGNAGVRIDACGLMAIEPVLAADPAEFPAGECTTVTGSGYTPDSTVTVQLTDADGNPVGDPIVVDTDANGEFTTDLCTTADTPPGDYTVVGTDDTTGTPAETPLMVTPAAVTPVLSVDPVEVVPGECTVVTGEGYTPDSTVTVQLTDADGNPVGDPVVVDTDANGAFTTDLCVPEDAEPGDYTVIGTDDTTGTPAETPLTVTPAAITPTIVADPAEVAPGESTDVTGEGYTPDSTVTVQLTDADGNPVGDPIVVDTDADGAFVTPLMVPEDAEPGDYTVVGTDDTTGTPAETPLMVTPAAVTPVLSVDPVEVAPGECTVVTGEGYTPDSTVTVQLTDADGNPVGDPVVVDTDANGAFTTDLCVPEDAEPGDYTVIGTDDTTGTPAETPLTVTPATGISPTIVADPDVVAQGETTDIIGDGYTPDSTVTIELFDADGNPVGDPIITATDGTGSFVLPAAIMEDTEPGDYTIVGTDDTTGTPAETPLTVAPAAITPALTVDPVEVAPGESTDVTGEGYTPDSTVTVQLTDADGNPVGDPVVVPTDADGMFTTPLMVPEDAEPGDYTVVGTDDTTGTPAEAPLTVTSATGITPSVAVDPVEVAPGESTDVTGEGYTPDSTVTVQLTDADGNPVGDPVVVPTDADGMFTTPLMVPEDAEPGDYTVVGTDDTTGIPAEAPLTVTPATGISPTIVADPDVVAQGDTTDIIGDGYTPDSTVTVELFDADGNPVGDPIAATTDGTGSFVLPVTIMEDTEPGDYTIVGTDDTTGIPAETSLMVTAAGIAPALTVDPVEVAPGESTDVTGEGYTPDSTVTVQLTDADGNPVGDPVVVPTDADGMFTTPLMVPEDAEPGDYTVVATDDATGTPAEAPLMVLDGDGGGVDPMISADPMMVAPGEATDITGTGYTPNGFVTLYLMDADGNVLGEPEPFEAGDDGTFLMPLNVPADAETGPHTVVGVDETTGLEATTMVYVTTDGGSDCSDPMLIATTEVVTVGDDVLVTGMGFVAGTEVEVQLTGIDGEPLGDPIMVTVNDSCGFQVTITVPEDSDPGLQVIIATPEDGSDGASVPIAVCGPEGVVRALDAWFEHGTVEPGDSQTFYASGFEPGEVVVGMIHSSSVALPGMPANEDGVVSWTFTVPADFAAGPHVGIATSTVFGDHAIAGFDVVVPVGSGNGDGDCDCENGDGNGNGNGDGSGPNGSGGPGGKLAATGSDASTLAAISFLLLAAGAVMIRRRQILSRAER